MEKTDAELIAAVLAGDAASFEPLVKRHSPHVFGLVRRHARRESEVEDLVQDIWLKAYQKLSGYRGEAPFPHWLARLAIHTCYDALRAHQRNREFSFTDLTREEEDWLERFVHEPEGADEKAAAAQQLVRRLLEELSPSARLVLQLLDIERRPVKEVAKLTGWSETLVKVSAWRARGQMKRVLARVHVEKYL